MLDSSLVASPEVDDDLRRHILIKPHALPAAECDHLVAIHRTFWPISERRNNHGCLVLFCPSLKRYEPERRDLDFIKELSALIQRQLNDFFAEPKTYVEAVFLSAALQYAKHVLHADNERYRDGHWEPNHTPRRDFTAILYLNSDFMGGGLCFPQHRICLKPEKGLLVAFPSTRYFLHEVHRISSGTRYTMQIWLTRNPDHAVW